MEFLKSNISEEILDLSKILCYDKPKPVINGMATALHVLFNKNCDSLDVQLSSAFLRRVNNKYSHANLLPVFMKCSGYYVGSSTQFTVDYKIIMRALHYLINSSLTTPNTNKIIKTYNIYNDFYSGFEISVKRIKTIYEKTFFNGEEEEGKKYSDSVTLHNSIFMAEEIFIDDNIKGIDPRKYCKFLLTLFHILKNKHQSIAYYVPNYKDSKSGRIFDLNGFQNLPSEYKGLLTEEFGYNYDVKSCFLNVVKYLLHKYNVKSEDRYIFSRIDTKELANKLKISRDLVKTILYSTLHLSLFNGNPSSSVTKRLIEEGFSKKKIGILSRKFNSYTKGLYSVMFNLSEKIIRDHLENEDTFKNVLGIPMKVKIRDGNVYQDGVCVYNQENRKYNSIKFRRQVISHFCIGYEQLYIQSTVDLCKKKRIPVLLNEHDGIITGEELPEYISKRKNKLGLELVQKPFKQIVQS